MNLTEVAAFVEGLWLSQCPRRSGRRPIYKLRSGVQPYDVDVLDNTHRARAGARDCRSLDPPCNHGNSFDSTLTRLTIVRVAAMNVAAAHVATTVVGASARHPVARTRPSPMTISNRSEMTSCVSHG
jgi:hypothetical protein